MDYSTYKFIKAWRDGRVLTLELNHPPMNAVHYLLHNELSRIFYDVQVDHEADIIVLTVAGDVARLMISPRIADAIETLH